MRKKNDGSLGAGRGGRGAESVSSGAKGGCKCQERRVHSSAAWKGDPWGPGVGGARVGVRGRKERDGRCPHEAVCFTQSVKAKVLAQSLGASSFSLRARGFADPGLVPPLPYPLATRLPLIPRAFPPSDFHAVSIGFTFVARKITVAQVLFFGRPSHTGFPSVSKDRASYVLSSLLLVYSSFKCPFLNL